MKTLLAIVGVGTIAYLYKTSQEKQYNDCLKSINGATPPCKKPFWVK